MFGVDTRETPTSLWSPGSEVSSMDGFRVRVVKIRTPFGLTQGLFWYLCCKDWLFKSLESRSATCKTTCKTMQRHAKKEAHDAQKSKAQKPEFMLVIVVTAMGGILQESMLRGPEASSTQAAVWYHEWTSWRNCNFFATMK